MNMHLTLNLLQNKNNCHTIHGECNITSGPKKTQNLVGNNVKTFLHTIYLGDSASTYQI